MNEAAETGNSLWPAIILGIYWAYVIIWNERRKQNERGTLFGTGAVSAPSGRSADNTAPTVARFDRSMFDREDFLARAKKAYEFILTSYAAGSAADLVGLVSPEVFAVFSREIERRDAAGEKMSLTFSALDDPEIIGCDSGDELDEVHVRFSAEIFVSTGVSATEEPIRLMNAVDLWTFRRSADSKNTAWVLTATDTE